MLGGPAYAAGTAGIIKGLVIDGDDLELPGAVVTLTSPSLIGGAQQRTTDDEGRFIFTELPPGSYDLSVAKPGFSTVTKRNVPLGLGRTVEMTIQMKLGNEVVDIVADRPVVDTEDTSTGQTYSQEFLSRIPTGRSYQDVVGNTPGVVDAGGGNPYSGGASSNENTFVLDGANITDPVTGTFSMNFNFDSIDEIQVTTTGFDPEYNALGAIISVATDSGGNSLKFNTAGYYSSGNWSPQYDARYASDGTYLWATGFDRNSQSATVGLEVSGPVVKDRIWFYGSYEYNRYLFASSGVPNARDYDSHYFYGKLTAQPSSTHRFTFQLQADPTTIDNLYQSRYFLPEAQERQAQGGYFTAAKWNWFPGPEMTTEIQATFQKSYIEGGPVPCTHDKELGYSPCDPDEAENNVDFLSPGRWGSYGAYYAQNAGDYDIDDRWRATIKGEANFLQIDLAGKHDIKVGAEFDYTAWQRVFGYSGNMIFVDAYVNAYDPDSLDNLYWYETTGPYVYQSSGSYAFAYLADSYKPIENLTIFGGLRYDYSVINNDVGQAVLDEMVFGPRISVSWDPFSDQKTKIFGGYGRFNDVGRLGISSYLDAAGFGYKAVLAEFYGGSGSSAGANVAFEVDGEDNYSLAGNLIAPHEDAFVIGADREVITDILLGVHFTAKFTRGVYSFDEINLIFDEDGYNYIGTGNGTSDPYYRMRTPLISRRDYYQTDVVLQRAFSSRWLMNLAYSYVVSKGTMQDSLGYGLSNPSQIDLMYGNLFTDIRHQMKFQIAWDIPNDPWTTRVGLAATFQTGSPLSRYYYAPAGSVYDLGGDGYGLLYEPLGTYGREGATYNISALLQQDIPVKQGALVAYAQLDNLTNFTTPQYISQEYINYQNRYVPYGRLYPISGEVGLRYEF